MRLRYGTWALAVLCAALVGSELWVVRENRALQQRIRAATTAGPRVNYLGTKGDRTRYAAGMFGRCRPFYTAAAQAPARTLNVSIYFSLQNDCMSCVQGLVQQWNGELQRAHGAKLEVTGYTEVDGTYEEKQLQDLKPAFPVVRVEGLKQKLATMGVTFTPVVFVTDPATGRILLTHAPLPEEKSNRAIVEALQALLTPCGA
jgi:hypothetical protein